MNTVNKRFIKYLAPYKLRFFFALACMVIYGVTDGVVPYILKRILDDIFGNQNKELLWGLVVFIVVFSIFRSVFGFLQRYISARVGLDVIRDIRNDIAKHILNLSPSFFDKHQTGSLVSRMTNDTIQVRSALTDAVAGLLRDSFRILGLAIAAIYLDPKLAMITLIGFPLCVLPIMKFGKKVRKHSKTGQGLFGDLASVLQESILGHKVIQAFTMEEYEAKKFAKENEKVTKVFRRAEMYSSLSNPTNEIIASFAIALVLLYGGFSVISGVRTQGDFIAFITAIFLLYEPVKKIGKLNNAIQTGMAAAERIFEILDAESDIKEAKNPEVLSSSRPSIEYRDVSFSYGKDKIEQWALRDVNLRIEAGSILALVGMSGGGKSTIVSLLLRYYDPQKGQILINGKPIDQYSLSSLRQHISMVSQHTFLFNDTIYNNILYGDFKASKEDVIKAAKAAYADDFINQLPEGYDTVIGEQGLRLSGGERARIAIARALLKNSPILVLDEATASLDSEAEELVQSAIDRLMLGRTVLVIAHRLATIRRANNIAAVVDGQVVEYGTHQELIDLDGEYAKLYKLQFGRSSKEMTSNQ